MEIYDSFLREDMLDPATAFPTVAVSLLFSHGRQAPLHLDTLTEQATFQGRMMEIILLLRASLPEF